MKGNYQRSRKHYERLRKSFLHYERSMETNFRIISQFMHSNSLPSIDSAYLAFMIK